MLFCECLTNIKAKIEILCVSELIQLYLLFIIKYVEWGLYPGVQGLQDGMVGGGESFRESVKTLK